MRIYYLFIIVALMACKSKKSKESASSNSETASIPKVALHHPDFTPGPHVMVYKTTKDFSLNVPIELDQAGNILSYPAPSDFKPNFATYLPVKLDKGYLLDKKGIGLQLAYLDWTIEDYSKLDSVPNIASLKSRLLDNSPLTELCDCGNANGFTDIVKQVNDIIAADSLSSICNKLK